MVVLTTIYIILAQSWAINTVIYTYFHLKMNLSNDINKQNNISLWLNKSTVVSYMIRSIIGMIDCFVLYFTFIFSENEYYRRCNLLHQCVRRCFMSYITRKQIRNQ